MPGLKVKPRELSVRRQFKSKRAKNDPTGTLKRIKRVEKEIVAKLQHTTQKIKENVVLHHRSLEIRKSTQINVDPETVNKTVERIIEAELVNPAFDIVEVEVPAAYRAGNTFGSIALGGTPEFRQDEAKKITVLVQASKSLFKGLGDDYSKKIKDIISRGILLEKSYGEIYKEIGDSVGVSEARAKAIVRTEVMKSVNTGVKERYKTAGVEKVEWLTVMDFKDDNNPCEECEELDGKTFPIGETPEIPVHPNCVLPDTRFIPTRDIISGLRAIYNGPVIEIATANGSMITVTPNHMFLTRNGFSAADLLKNGDDILYCPWFEGIISQYPNNDGNPTTISDIFKSFLVSGSGTPTTVPVSSKYLHNDGIFCKGNIDIIRANGLLWNGLDTTFDKDIIAGDLDPGHFTDGLFSFSTFAEILKRLASATDGGMSSIRQSGSFFRSRIGHSIKHRLTPISNFNPTCLESGSDACSGEVKSIAQLLDRYSGIIESQKIVSIDVHTYHGEVYDLETISTLSIGNGFIMSNCRCTLIPVIEMPEGDWYDDEEEQQDTDLDTHIDDFNSRFKDSDIEHGRVFDSSGKLVEEVTGNKNSVNYNTDRKNMHSIHNHPNGCPALSPEDIASAIYEDMASQTASNGSESWTLSRPDSGWKISGFEYDTKIDLISQIKTEFSDIIKNSPEREKYKSRVLSGDISVKEANLEFTKHVSRTFLENHKLTILERK